MLLAKKVKFIIKTLNELYPNPCPPLHFHSNFTLLIAVLLSANCTDKAVNKVTKVLFEKADTPELMRKLGVKKIKQIIRPCGLSEKKSQAIYQLSQIIIQEHNNQVPNNFTALEKLPGVGHKTASVVLAQGFNIPTFPVDTHIHRLAYRWELSNGTNVKKTEADLKEAFPQKNWNNLHLQMIYYGREFCKARGHVIDNCSICQKITSS